jgi:rubrerythrin
MLEELTTIEIMGLAIRSEEEAAAFYGEMARNIRNDLVKVKYESFAREEVSHKLILLKLYKKLTGGDAPPPIPGEPATAEGGMQPAHLEDMKSLLELAISREHKAHAFYKEMAKGMKDANSRRVIEYLAGIERGHEAMLKSELEAYLKDRDWYADKPDIQLV